MGNCILKDLKQKSLVTSCALHTAVTGTNTEIVKCLIENGFSVDSRKTNGTTPIHWAYQKGNLSMVALLLSYNANPHATDYDGNGILHYAAEEGNLEIVKLLQISIKEMVMDFLHFLWLVTTEIFM